MDLILAPIRHQLHEHQRLQSQYLEVGGVLHGFNRRGREQVIGPHPLPGEEEVNGFAGLPFGPIAKHHDIQQLPGNKPSGLQGGCDC